MNTTSSSNASGMALVTGGSRGIGAAICKRLAAAGYSVAVCYGRDTEAAGRVVEAITNDGGTARSFQADLDRPDSISGLFQAAEDALGPLSALVANAGIIGDKLRIDEQSGDGLEHLFRVNVISPMLCAREAVKRLSTTHKGRGGSILLISSVAARLGGMAGLVPYASTKGAVETFTKGLATEVAAEGIRVNAVAPGVIDTDMPTADIRAAVEKGVPLGRLGQAGEVAEAVAWLISDAASFVTGEVLTVSGGR